MKKFIALILVVLCCSLLFAACRFGDNGEGGFGAAQTTQTTDVETTAVQTTDGASSTNATTAASSTKAPSSSERWSDWY